MPRRSPRGVAASSAAPAATVSKRRASERLSAASETPAKRPRSDPEATSRSTSKQSKYFDHDSQGKLNSESAGSNYESSTEESSPPYEDTRSTKASATRRLDSRKVTAKGKPGRSRGSTKVEDGVQSSPAEDVKAKELWREGVRTGLGPGKVVFIKKPKARDAGDIPYEDHTLHPNTMLFLQDLKENNDREWLKAHDADYRAAKKDWESFVESLGEKIMEKDSTIPELPTKDLTFRIHRDIRFSKDPTPYKTHFSAAWSRTGKKGPYASYYVHLQPGGCLVASGLWMPEADKLSLLREAVDRQSHRLKSVLRLPDIRREIFGGIGDDEEQAVKAFIGQNKENALKTRPKGYDIDNQNISLLRLRNYTIWKSLPDSDFLSVDSQDKIASLIGVMEPFVTYLNSVVMPDAADQEPTDQSDDN